MNIPNAPRHASGKIISGEEQQILARMRQDVADTIRAMYPKSTDDGLSEIKQAIGKMAEIQVNLMKAIKGRTIQMNGMIVGGMTQSELRGFVFDGFFNGYKSLSEDERALIWCLSQSDNFMQEHGLRGLPQ